MAVSWTTITNAQVAAGAPLTTALVTALRDNPEGIAQRASGALKAFNVPYNYQEFTANGTWTKPTDAETGDEVFVELCAGGEACNVLTPGQGGAGAIFRFDIDDLGATEAVVVGAGGTTAGGNGGNSSFGTSGTVQYRAVTGGGTGTAGATIGSGGGSFADPSISGAAKLCIYGGGNGSTTTLGAENLNFGAGHYHGRGGLGRRGLGVAGEDGEFPGGGGGGSDAGQTVGGDGVVRVYCIKRN